MSTNQRFDTFQSFIKQKRAFPGPRFFRQNLATSLESLMWWSGNHSCRAEIRESHPQPREIQDHQCGEKRRSGPFPHSKKSIPMLPTPSPHTHSSPHRASATPQPRPRCCRAAAPPGPGGATPAPATAWPPPGPARRRPGRLLLPPAPPTATTGAAPGPADTNLGHVPAAFTGARSRRGAGPGVTPRPGHTARSPFPR